MYVIFPQCGGCILSYPFWVWFWICKKLFLHLVFNVFIGTNVAAVFVLGVSCCIVSRMV